MQQGWPQPPGSWLGRLAALGEDPDVIPTGLLVVAIAALIGGRLYHVIDQWHLYANDPLKIVLPPYSGLGVYGGIITGTLAAIWYTRRRGLSFWRWADIIAPGLFTMQAIARWGNFFNQELYGGPTTLPWGIADRLRPPRQRLSLLGVPCPDDLLPSALPLRIGLGAGRPGVHPVARPPLP